MKLSRFLVRKVPGDWEIARYCLAVVLAGVPIGCGGNGSPPIPPSITPDTDVQLVSILDAAGPKPPRGAATSDYPAVSSSGDLVAFRSAWRDDTNDANTANNTLLSLRSTCTGPSQSCQTGTTPLLFVSAGEDDGTVIESQALSSSGRYMIVASSSFSMFSGLSGDAYVLDTCANSPGCAPGRIYDVAVDIFSGTAISASGRFVTVTSNSKIIVQDSCLGTSDTCTPATVWTGNYEAGLVAIAADGRHLVFDSVASVVADDHNALTDVFWVDACLGAPPTCTMQITRLSVAGNGAEANGASRAPAMSDDGRFVAFESEASNLVSGDTNGFTDVFLSDTCLGVATGCNPQITRLSVATDGSEGNGASQGASISADGRFVAFVSEATNLVSNDTNGAKDIFVRDTCTNVSGCVPRTIRVSLAADNSQANGDSTRCAISADGAFVAYTSRATNLIKSATTGEGDIFLVKVRWP
jgi:hypothetical protein